MLSSLIRITEILNTLKTRYCLIGGLAVAVHGVPRFTDDLDFLVDPLIKKDFAELKKIIIAEKGSASYIKAGLSDPLGDVIKITLFNNQIDLITAKRPYEFSALSRAKPESFHALTLNVVSPEDLILLKLNAGGPQDLYDVAGIIKIYTNQIDYTYIKAGINTNYLKEKWLLAERLLD